jgi:predicted transcriptional regulator
VNKVLTRTGDIFVSTALNQDLLLVLSQLEKPLNPDVLKVSSNDIISLVKILKLNGINRKIFKDIYLKLFLILKLLIYRLVKQMNFSHLKQ